MKRQGAEPVTRVKDTLNAERVVLADPGQLSNLSTHAFTYAFALPHVQGKTVLELCCGTGYGTKLLAEAAQSIIGVDYSETTIDYANRWRPDNCRFLVGDVEQETYGSPEVVVCFQGLEHLDDPKATIGRYPDSLWVFAVPVGRDGVNQFHHHTIGYDTLQDWFGTGVGLRYMVDSVGIFSEPPALFQNYFGIKGVGGNNG